MSRGHVYFILSQLVVALWYKLKRVRDESGLWYSINRLASLAGLEKEEDCWREGDLPYYLSDRDLIPFSISLQQIFPPPTRRTNTAASIAIHIYVQRRWLGFRGGHVRYGCTSPLENWP